MPKLLQINVSANWGSHGKIAEAIGKLTIQDGWESMIAFGRNSTLSESQLVKIGTEKDIKIHGINTRILDRHGLASTKATETFIKIAKDYNPDIIHLHNIHGYYLNYPVLFKWLKEAKKPVVWTLHDCWPWTGHCAHYTYLKCSKWQTECNNCQGISNYPKSYWDGSKRNFALKKQSFLRVEHLNLVPVSEWLKSNIRQSFLKDYPTTVIHNGIDINKFKPTNNISEIREKFKLGEKKILLGVASVWHKLKGFDEFLKLRSLLSEDYLFILVGLNDNQISNLPKGIVGINRTNNVQELADLYSAADLFLNPTLEDNFPTTNLEALACGTPVITYDTGGSPEAIDENTGIVIPYRDINALKEAIVYTCEKRPFSHEACRLRAELNFNQDNTFVKYLDLYKSLLKKG